jgi:hypothetical protein
MIWMRKLRFRVFKFLTSGHSVRKKQNLNSGLTIPDPLLKNLSTCRIPLWDASRSLNSKKYLTNNITIILFVMEDIC